ncbi:phytoene desaturase family protein [Saltatorellus ferox]|uniref:phytoene desaturase family protein n=1 Tax=Saltatorellus ferox TaxID=2528018 RepID=UPI003AF397B2
MTETRSYDAVVVGMGFGGLGAALHLAENGAKVALVERLQYPGGCACTFEHEGDHFEGGATLFSGFDEGQLFRTWIERHAMDVQYERLDPPLELRSPLGVIQARRDRAALWKQFEALPGAPVQALRRFARLQERVAAALWPTLDDLRLLPPLTPSQVLRHAARLPRYLPLARLAGRTLWSVLERFGLTKFEPLVLWLDSQCQITVQCGVRGAEAPFALAALDYHHRGAVHVKGGIGELAWGMVRAVEALGADVHFGAPVKRALRLPDGTWSVKAGRHSFSARHVLFNALPQDAARIAGLERDPMLASMAKRVEDGWSAAMLFRTVLPPRDAGPSARHLELVRDPGSPLLEGNHVFVSIGARGEGTVDQGLRRMTVSTHIPVPKIRAMDEGEKAEYVDSVQGRMRETIAQLAPEWTCVAREFTGSARTFERWTGRSEGLVGGIPRRAGLGQYREVFGRKLPEGFHLVGDSVFPGQSTLAVAAGGARVADSVLRSPMVARVSR